MKKKINALNNAPTGQVILAQGNALGKNATGCGALKGQVKKMAKPITTHKINLPFQGVAFYYLPQPRALPWAKITCPVGAFFVNLFLQNS